MSSEEILQQNKINKHVCIGLDKVDQIIKSCQICGLMMDKKNGTKTFHRSNKYSLVYFRNDINRVFDQMFQKQVNNRTFNQNPPHIQFRAALIDYISQLSDKLDYSKKTLHLCITIIDQVFSKCRIKQQDINLIAIVSLMIAAKMEENDAKIPLLTHIIQKLNGKFKQEDFTSCERTIFSGILNYNSNIITSYDFATEFLFKGILSGKEIGWNVIQQKHSMELVNFFDEIVCTFIDFALKHYEFYYFTAAAVAAASVACARKIFGTEEIWNEDMTNLTRYSLQYIQQCSNLLIQLFAIEEEETLQRLFDKRDKLKDKIKQNYFFEQSPITASQSKYVQNNDNQNLSSFSFQQDNFFIEELNENEQDLENSVEESRLFLQESTQESLLRNNSLSFIENYQKQKNKTHVEGFQQTVETFNNGINKTQSDNSVKESL